ncbi:MAG: hypothetical protein NTU81_01340 [Candidatus Nomurabacteria bacterium]|nr:hypothetical protein [Candidatus Nomurabacteria bacterium]
MKIGILYICTGKYTIFWKDFYLSMEKNFIEDSEKHYFVFTDSNDIDFENENPRIHRIHQNDLGWPYNTLKRFHIFLEHEKELVNMDYLFFFNANLFVLEKINSKEFLPIDKENLVATLHPGFYDKEKIKFTYDRNTKSTAYIPKGYGDSYFAGGLNGGKTIKFIEAMKIIRDNVDIDNKKNVIALWHDESHWNKYLIERSDVKILTPSYLYPEGWTLPFKPIILIRDKNKYGGHNLLRNSKNTFYNILINALRNIFSKIVKKIPNLWILFIYHKTKSIIETQGIKIEKTPLLIITIAFNNIEILKTQYIYIKNNLQDDFIYMIADNSSVQNISNEIKKYCKDNKIPYVKLPPNPYNNPSKSHGMALNWTYKNIVKTYEPVLFGFIDHDIFPYQKTSIISSINSGIFGLIQVRNEKWYLWPGFCFYKYIGLKTIKINFMPKKGLDTGGANYYTLYKNINKDLLIKIPQIYIDINTNTEVKGINDTNTANTVECIGDWLHLMRVSNWNNKNNNKIHSVEEIISKVKKIL